MIEILLGWGGLSVADHFAGSGDEDALLSLMIEVDVEHGRTAVVPNIPGDGEMEENHALGELPGVDDGLAEEGFGGERFELGKGGVNGGEILFFDGAGGEDIALGGGEGGGEVLEKEREVEAVVDADGGEDVEVVLRLIVADESGVGLENGVGGKDEGAGDLNIRCSAGGGAYNQCYDNAEDHKGDENRSEKVAAGGLGEVERRHFE
jgi:hypothetical protein